MSQSLVIFNRIVSALCPNVKHPRVTKSPQIPRINPPTPNKYTQDLDRKLPASYNTFSNQQERTYVSCVFTSTEAAL